MNPPKVRWFLIIFFLFVICSIGIALLVLWSDANSPDIPYMHQVAAPSSTSTVSPGVPPLSPVMSEGSSRVEEAPLPVEEAPRPTESKLEVIIAGTKGYLGRFKSGRIVYTRTASFSPTKFSDEEIEKGLNIMAEGFRKKGIPEDRIESHLSEYRVRLEERRMETEWVKSSVEGEYVFKGPNAHATIKDRSRDEVYERFIKNGKDIIIMSRLTTKDGYEVLTSQAEVAGPSRASAFLDSPLETLLRNTEWLEWKSWSVSGTEKRDGSSVYRLQDESDGDWSHFLEIDMEKRFAITRHTQRRSDNAGLIRTHQHQYNNLAWDASAEVYYPREIVIEHRTQSSQGDDRIYRAVYTLNEVKLNIDIPDETFDIPFTEGLEVTDYRFDPPKHYAHEYPQELEEYMRTLDEQVRALKN